MAKAIIKVLPPSGDPHTPEVSNENVLLLPNKTPIDQNFDLRDRLTELVASGNNLKGDDRAAIFGNLTTLLGKDKAQKIMTHAYIFNTHPEYQKLPLEQKIQKFYDMGSQDPDVQDVITKTKNLGYGVKEGFRNSFSQINQALSGKGLTATTEDPDIQKKIMLKVTK